MATDKNITMKQFNGTDYDTLYPKTIASQIPDVYSKSYIDSMLKNNAKIQTGSYVGTGTYGANNPCTLTFDFIPYLIMITSDLTKSGKGSATGPFLISMNGQTISMGYLDTTNNCAVIKVVDTSWNSKTFSWCDTRSGTGNGGLYQLNKAGIKYYYVAIA